MLLQGLKDKSLKYVATRLSYVVRENNEDFTKLGCDKESRSRQEVILGPREECYDKSQGEKGNNLVATYFPGRNQKQKLNTQKLL